MGRSKEVDAWFARYDNPMKEVVQRIRAIILAADPRMDECIKWQAPTFTCGGNLASFYPKSKACGGGGQRFQVVKLADPQARRGEGAAREGHRPPGGQEEALIGRVAM